MAILHGFEKQLLLGASNTVALAGAALTLGTLIGALVCWVCLDTHRAVRAAGQAYIASVAACRIS